MNLDVVTEKKCLSSIDKIEYLKIESGNTIVYSPDSIFIIATFFLINDIFFLLGLSSKHLFVNLND
jgi:hypothetical protein